VFGAANGILVTVKTPESRFMFGKVFKSCKNLIRTLPALCYSKSQPDDVDNEAEDNCYDALRYGLTRRKIEFRSVRVRMRF
jgi:hypothetical protein